jgi:hypothetical protein
MQVSGALAADEMAGIPLLFYNVEVDDAADIRDELFRQLDRMRTGAAEHMLDLCYAVEELIVDHETQAVSAAVEEVAAQLRNFLQANRKLGARERLAHVDAVATVRSVRYASTLWAATRRNGEYSGLNIVHQVGVGAARDARLRCDSWFKSLDAFLNALKIDSGLALAEKTIDQIGKSAAASKAAFIESVQRAGMEVYREPLTQSPVWNACSSEWGRGPGFKTRVADHLEQWFARNGPLKDKLEDIATGFWEQTVISPLLRLSDETASDESGAP